MIPLPKVPAILILLSIRLIAHAIEKRIIAKARLNEEDDYYSEVKKNGCWKNYFVVNVESKILERMRENGGSIPEESVLYEIFYGEIF